MDIQRSKPRESFLVVSNSVCRDRRLSYKARGLLIHLLSLPPNAKAKLAGLCGHRTKPEDASEGRVAVLAAMKELRAVGYVSLITLRRADGTFAKLWRVFDSPADNDVPDGSEVRDVAEDRDGGDA